MTPEWKMYVLLRKSMTMGFAMNSAVHVAMEAYHTWWTDPSFLRWKEESNHVVTCAVTDDEFEDIRELANTARLKYIAFEEDDLGGLPVALAFFPTIEWPEAFRKLKLAGEAKFNGSLLPLPK